MIRSFVLILLILIRLLIFLIIDNIVLFIEFFIDEVLSYNLICLLLIIICE